jgi:hypothetical protein
MTAAGESCHTPPADPLTHALQLAAENGRELDSGGHQWSSVVITVVISGHQWSSVSIRGKQW